MKSEEQTQAQHGATIARLTALLNKEIVGYLAKSTGEFGTPNERRKQKQIVTAYISAGLDCLDLPNMAEHRRWLNARPQSGLIVK
jgi:hypothetical protein